MIARAFCMRLRRVMLPLDAARSQLDIGRIRAHVAAAIQRASVDPHPTPHLVVDRILPDDV